MRASRPARVRSLAACSSGALAALIAACASEPSSSRASGADAPDDGLARAARTITAPELAGHVATLASDAFEGRGPGTPGEERTVAYLTERFREIGLEPGNPDGTWVQSVPLVGMRATPLGSFATPKGPLALAFPDHAIALTRRMVPSVEVAAAPVVFVGYGVVAPEHGWDDFAGVDVAGKTIVMLVNDPQVERAPGVLDERAF